MKNPGVVIADIINPNRLTFEQIKNEPYFENCLKETSEIVKELGCICCQAKTMSIGAFTPSDENNKRFRVPDGMMRIFFYGFCLRCLNLENKRAEAEEIALKLVNAGG